MKYVSLPENARNTRRRLPFYLAMEEVVAHRYASALGDLFFMWQVEPTVICGRHQWMDTELDLDYCRSAGIDVVRRRSGGGAVFADMNNIMFSYISPGDEVTTTFARYTGMVAAFLRSLGLDSSTTSRNDVLIGDRKVSGCAFYHTGKANIAHGTMLFDTDFATMSRALTPSRAKLKSKGVTSVQSRVTTITSHLPDLTIERFKELARQSLCGSEFIELTPDDIAEIEHVELSYRNPEWLAPRRGRHGAHTDSSMRRRIEGAGEFIIDTETRNGLITRIGISGDFLSSAPIAPILDALVGQPATQEAILNNLPAVIPITGIDTQTLAGLITDAIDSH